MLYMSVNWMWQALTSLEFFANLPVNFLFLLVTLWYGAWVVGGSMLVHVVCGAWVVGSSVLVHVVCGAWVVGGSMLVHVVCGTGVVYVVQE